MNGRCYYFYLFCCKPFGKTSEIFTDWAYQPFSGPFWPGCAEAVDHQAQNIWLLWWSLCTDDFFFCVKPVSVWLEAHQGSAIYKTDVGGRPQTDGVSDETLLPELSRWPDSTFYCEVKSSDEPPAPGLTSEGFLLPAAGQRSFVQTGRRHSGRLASSFIYTFITIYGVLIPYNLRTTRMHKKKIKACGSGGLNC